MSDNEDQNAPPKRKHDDFDCPNCNANNPYDDGIHDGEEVRCFYCGAEFRARIDENGKLKLREL